MADKVKNGVSADCQHPKACLSLFGDKEKLPCELGRPCLWPPTTRIVQPSYTNLTGILAKSICLHNCNDIGKPNGKSIQKVFSRSREEKFSITVRKVGSLV